MALSLADFFQPKVLSEGEEFSSDVKSEPFDPLLERYIKTVFPKGHSFPFSRLFMVDKVVNIIDKQVRNHQKVKDGRTPRFGFDADIEVVDPAGDEPIVLILTFVHMVKRVSIYQRPPADFVIGVMKEMMLMGYSFEIQDKVYLKVTLPSRQRNH